MFLRLYYTAKPWLPFRLRLALRRWHARRMLRRCGDVWPILESAGRKPDGWPGWPDGKQFAFVLTHDVESQAGLERVKPLAELEMSLGFRSSFNFIPEGPYRVPKELRDWLTDRGFEVGVHDLHHDGRLYRSRDAFRAHAQKINRYLEEWNAVGFRSAFMHRNLEWLHDLNISYDSSTFDTDPFEPQPEGVGTIFPFFVPKAGSKDQETKRPKDQETTGLRDNRTTGPHVAESAGPLVPSSHGPLVPSSLGPLVPSSLGPLVPSSHNPLVPSSLGPFVSSSGYLELPYTLPQDSTLFLLLKEKSPAIWLHKLDWIANHGGMALVNVHPDYLGFNGSTGRQWEVPVGYYEQLLRDVADRHARAYWQALPRMIVARVRSQRAPVPGSGPGIVIKAAHQPRPKIWIDLDNTPHVPFFEPIIEELQSRGYPLLVTARDAFQVVDLAKSRGLQCVTVGRHYGKHRLAKVYGLLYRALQMLPLVLRERPQLAVSHGARSQLLLSNLLRIPSLLIEDYEHARFPWLTRPAWVLAPDAIPKEALPQRSHRICSYPGLKEDVYAWKLKPDPRILTELGIQPGVTVVIVRPPATEAHYHNPETEALFTRFMDRATGTLGTQVVLLPRTKSQADHFRLHHAPWFRHNRTVISPTVLDGLNLLWHSDLVVSGGGTMNREAAALGVPVYSIFRGRTGGVDHQLSREGRLVLVVTAEDVDTLIRIEKRPPRPATPSDSRRTLLRVVDTIAEIAERHNLPPRRVSRATC